MLASLVSFAAATTTTTTSCTASAALPSQSWSSRSLRKPILGKTNGTTSTKSQTGEGGYTGDLTRSASQRRFLLAEAAIIHRSMPGSRRKEEGAAQTSSSSSSSFPICHSSSGAGTVAIDEAPDEITEFVEIGTIAETHGVHGELRVRSLTDFPVERFETPGVRYIRRIIMGKVSMLHVELLKGREIPGKQSSWLVTLKGFKTREEASELLGSTMLVSADQRPSMEDEDIYIPDLVGMSVIMQETKEEIGMIVDVHSSSGASDLLRVRLASTINSSRDVQVWIPFVKEIVPLVDNETRRIEITPPAGLLELNVPKEGASKKKKSTSRSGKTKAISAADIKKR